jgi:hypothetical protein
MAAGGAMGDGASSGGILAVSEGDGMLRADGGSNVPNSVGDTTVPVIGAISVDSSLDASDVLVPICGGGGSVVIGSGGTNALGAGGDNSILGIGDLSTGGRCPSGSSCALAARKCGGGLRVGDGNVPATSGAILGTGNGGGPDRVVIHDLPVPQNLAHHRVGLRNVSASGRI